MNVSKAQKRLQWLEQTIVDGRCEPWMYYHAAEAASAAGNLDKANRYLRIALSRGWSHDRKVI